MSYENLFIGDFSDDDKNKIYIKEPLEPNSVRFEKDGFTIKFENGVELIHVANGIVVRAAGNDMPDASVRTATIDKMVCHKWPEEKPEKGGQYLVRIISPSGSVYYSLRGYEDGEWHNFGNYLTHWWNLPEVGNE